MASPYETLPSKFFTDEKYIVVQQEDFVGLNVGYECGTWRYESFAEYLFKWLLQFGTKFSDLVKLDTANAWDMIKRAAKMVYQSDRYEARGEFGELMLYAILRELFGTQPAVSKLYYKSAANDTVKGFDAVHVRKNREGGVELWLGEVKFYKDIQSAIADVVSEIECHIGRDKLKEEFICVGAHIDDDWEFAPQVKALFDGNKSLDDIFPIVCIPVLLTYESPTIQSAQSVSEAFLTKLREELLQHYSMFNRKSSAIKLKIQLILLPLDKKEQLLKVMDAKLKGLQR